MNIQMSNIVGPSFALGLWKVAPQECAGLVYEAIKGGVRHLDCACDYGNEVETGEGLSRAIKDGIVTREDMFITSKLWNTYHRKEHVKLAAEKSLKDLKVDYFDLYMIHFPISIRFVPLEKRYPPSWVFDDQCENPRIEIDRVPISETWTAMEGLVDDKLARSVGVCNFNVQLISDLLSYCRIRPAALQVELHPYNSQTSLVAFCLSEGIQVYGFSPLGSPSYIELGMDKGEGGGLLTDATLQAIATIHNKRSMFCFISYIFPSHIFF